MRIKKIISIAIINLLIIGCSPTLKLFTGIRDIRVEPIDDLKVFCLENDMNLNDVYYYKANEQFSFPDSSQINFQFADQVLIFNKDGHQIIYQGKETGNYCSLPGSDFFTGLNSIFLPLDSNNNLDHILGNYRNIESDNLAEVYAADFYLVYYWAKWHRKFSKRSFKEIPTILSNANDSLSIQCFYLNNDFVEINYPDTIDFKKFKIDLHF